MIPCSPEDLVAILTESETQLTARAYVEKIAAHLDISRPRAKKVLKQLVNDQQVAFQDLYGSTYVMEDFSKPVQITDRFFILPPGVTSQAREGQLDIRILPGISFGSGHHPTTRMSLGAIDFLFSGAIYPPPRGMAGDVGTGSGILALALCLAGMTGCMAWEIDANAVNEARQNVAANNLSQRIQVVDAYMPPQKTPLSLICANLRAPTLKDLQPLFFDSLAPNGYLVLSGLRSWEKEDLVALYTRAGASLIWEKEMKHWAALVLWV